jgi:hypothetical protein
MTEKLTKRVGELTQNGKKEIALYASITIDTNDIVEDIKGLFYVNDEEETAVYLITKDDTEIPLTGLDDCEEIATMIMDEIEDGNYEVVNCVE